VLFDAEAESLNSWFGCTAWRQC